MTAPGKRGLQARDATDRGHDFHNDSSAVMTSMRRETCSACGRARITRPNGTIYGSATERDCDASATETSKAAETMPEGFTDRAAWDAIHWRFSERGSVLDDAVRSWQLSNQERVRAAAERLRATPTKGSDG